MNNLRKEFSDSGNGEVEQIVKTKALEKEKY